MSLGPMVCLSLALAVASSSAAAPPEASGAPHAQLDEALAALDALEMERARDLLEPLVTSAGLPDATRARAWLALGLTRASLLDTDGARAAFAAALSIDGALAVPEGTSPKVTQLFEKTRATLLREGAVPSRTPTTPPPAPPPSSTSGRAEQPAQQAQLPPPIDANPRWPWLLAGGALLAGSGLAAGGALFADAYLASPEPGRTRAEYEGARALGVVALASSAVLLTSATLAFATSLSMEDAAAAAPAGAADDRLADDGAAAGRAHGGAT